MVSMASQRVMNHIESFSVNPRKKKHKAKRACDRNLNNSSSSLFGHVFTHKVRSSKGIEGVDDENSESAASNSTPQASLGMAGNQI